MLELLLVLSSLVGPGIERAGPALDYAPPAYGSGHLIRFSNNLVVDTRTAALPDSEAKLAPGSYWLVNLAGPVRQEWLSRLRRTGLQPVCYLAYQTLVCRAAQTVNASAVLDFDFVCWLGPHPAAAKLAPEFEDLAGPVECVLALWPAEPAEPVAQALLSSGAVVSRVGPGTIRFRANADRIPAIARLEPVAWVQVRDSACPFNTEAQWVMQVGWQPQIPDPVQGRRIWHKGIRGQGMVVGLFDSGINTDHDQFCDPIIPIAVPGLFPDHRKIAAYRLYSDADFGDSRAASYHGSAVAATLAGNDSLCGNYSKADGVAIDARLCFVDIGKNNGNYVYGDDLTEPIELVRRGLGSSKLVRQVSGSFGSEVQLGYYRVLDATLDAAAWTDKNFLIVWAAGNFGTGEYRIGHPACAKNALTVGATENATASNLVASFSSRGPTRDGRIKPNIVAPGKGVTTADGPGGSVYSLRNGTSFSAPATSGALVLLRQYFGEGWFPLGRPDSSRSVPLLSAALMRAFAITGADSEVGNRTIPNKDVGWGRFDLGQVLHFEDDSVRLTFVDETLGLATGQFHDYSVEVVDRKPLRVVLAWTDTAAAPLAQTAIVNDLDLEAISPDRNSYHGNRLLEGQSRSNPLDWDTLNVEEVCQLNLPLTGRWTIRVRGRNVYAGPQPYAVVVKGAIAGLPGVAEGRSRIRGEPVRPRTYLVTRTQPLVLPVPRAASLKVHRADGRLVRSLTSVSGAIVWDGTDVAGRRLPAGVYLFLVCGSGRDPELGRLVLIR